MPVCEYRQVGNERVECTEMLRRSGWEITCDRCDEGHRIKKNGEGTMMKTCSIPGCDRTANYRTSKYSDGKPICNRCMSRYSGIVSGAVRPMNDREAKWAPATKPDGGLTTTMQSACAVLVYKSKDGTEEFLKRLETGSPPESLGVWLAKIPADAVLVKAGEGNNR